MRSQELQRHRPPEREVHGAVHLSPCRLRHARPSEPAQPRQQTIAARLLDWRSVVRLLVLFLAALPPCATQTPLVEDPNWLGPFVPTPAPIVRELLKLARVGEGDVVYDLGSGDGRVILAAAERFDARAVGIEWDRRLCAETEAAIRAAGLEKRVQVIHGDIFEQDFTALPPW